MKSNNKILMISILFMLILISSVSANDFWYNPLNVIGDWTGNLPRATVTNGALNGTSLQITSEGATSTEVARSTAFYTNWTGANSNVSYNISFWVNITIGSARDDISIGIEPTVQNHIYDGAMLYYSDVGGDTTFFARQNQLGFTNKGLFDLAIISNGNKKKFTFEFNNSNNSSYNFYINDILNASGLIPYAQGGGFMTQRNQSNKVKVYAYSEGTLALIYLDDISIYNQSGAGGGDTGMGNITINITSPFPLNNTQYSTNRINFNISVNSSFDFNCSLYINDTLNKTSDQTLAGTWKNISLEVNMSTVNSAIYNYTFNCNNGINQTISNVNLFFVDFNFPSITSGFENNLAIYSGQFIRQFNFTDDFSLFSMSIWVDNNLFANKSMLNTTSYSFNFTFNTSNVSIGMHTLRINVSDGHTAKSIPDFDYSLSRITNKITYGFGNDYISIQSKDGSVFDTFETQKKEDRYSFNYDRNSIRGIETFIVKSNKPIVVIKDNRLVGWLIIPSLNKWIDFETKSKYDSYSLTQISDYELEITFNGLKDEKIEFNSIGELNTLSRVYNFYVGNVTTYLTTPVTESQLTTFRVVFDKNASIIRDINATLWWNGTYYNYDNKTNGTTQINFSRTLNIPLIDGNLDVNVSWNYTIFAVNNTEINITFPQLQSIYNIIIAGCNDTSANATLILRTYDEDSLLITPNVSVKMTLEVRVNDTGTSAINYTFDFNASSLGTTTGAYNYTICISPFNTSYSSNAFIDYQIDSRYTQRNYFLVKFGLGNFTRNVVDLYLANVSKVTDSTITVVDENNNALVEHYVKVLRYYPNENIFRIVEIARTSSDGKAQTRLILNNIWYKFIVDNGIENIFISANQKVTTSTLFLQAQLGSDFIEQIKKLGSLDYSLTYNNVTGLATFMWNDVSNIVREGCFRVTNVTGAVEYAVCNNCLTAASGTLTCQLNATLETRYVGMAYIDTYTKFSHTPIDMFISDTNHEFRTFGIAGLILQMILTGILTAVGLWRPTTALVFGALSVIAGIALGTISFSYGALMFFLILIGVMIGIIKD